MPTNFLPAAQALSDQLSFWRRDLHQHPELAFQETRTAGMVAARLAELAIEVQSGVGRTGVVGVLEGAHPGPTVMLRFDMDALPIQEETGLPFTSYHHGRMHACGHDGHTAIGLGVARLLAERQSALAGRVKFVFQPAEEIANGALAMIADGVLQEPAPDVLFGLHLWSLTPLGEAIVKAGPLWAASDRITLEITGRGSHGAMPHQGVDAIAVTAYAIAQLQTVISRMRDPLHPAVLSIGTIHGGDAFNILAERVRLTGTLRTFDAAARTQLMAQMEQVLAGVCAAHGASYRLECFDYAPPVINDRAAAEHLHHAATAVLGDAAVHNGPMMMVAEDVAEFLQRVPGCFFVLGAQPRHAAPEPHHSPRFDIDEAALPLGAAILAQAAFDWVHDNA